MSRQNGKAAQYKGDDARSLVRGTGMRFFHMAYPELLGGTWEYTKKLLGEMDINTNEGASGL